MAIVGTDNKNLTGKFAYTLSEFRQMGGPCRAACYKLFKSGGLRAVKAGDRTLIPAQEVERYFANLPAYEVAS